MANIETEKFNNMVQAIGSDTISAIAISGPEMQVCVMYVLNILCIVCFYPFVHSMHMYMRMCLHVRGGACTRVYSSVHVCAH